MKLKSRLLALCIVLSVLAFSACSPAVNSDRNAGNSRTDDGSVRGIVTSVSSDVIEIALMQGNRAGGNAPQRTGDRGNLPSDSPQPDGSTRPQGSMDLSNAEKVQYTIDANTKIVKMEFSGQGGQSQGQNQGNVLETAAGISDVTNGVTVSITPRSGSDRTADKIVIQSFGARSQDQPQGSLPPQSSTAAM